MPLDLAQRRCEPCEGVVEPLRADQSNALMVLCMGIGRLAMTALQLYEHSTFQRIAGLSDSLMRSPG